MIKELTAHIREYKKASILSPILVSVEVVMECIIPFIIAQLVNEIKAGSEFGIIVKYGIILVIMAGFHSLLVRWLGRPALRHLVDLQKICERICFIKFKRIHSKILTNFPPRLW